MNMRKSIYILLLISACAPAPDRLIATTPPAPALTAEHSPTLTPPAVLTPPPAASPTAVPEVHFALIGDYGDAAYGLPAVAELVSSWQPDLILTLGDNNYPDGSAETIDENIGQFFAPYISPYKGEYGPGGKTNRFFPVLGNHDWSTNNAQPYLDYFSLPGNERYYHFSWEFVEFFMLDSDGREPDGIGRSSTQAAWLQQQLAASNAVWKIVILHVPPYASTQREQNLALRWPFIAWGADIVFSGHEHFYERLIVDGFPYIVNGLGGGARYGFGDILPESQLRFRGTHGALLVVASRDILSIQFIGVGQEIIDAFQLPIPE